MNQMWAEYGQSFLGLAAGAEFLLLLLMCIRDDRHRASQAQQRFLLEAHLARATEDGRDTVRIPAEQLKRLWKLDGRALQDARTWNGKGGKHPAVVTPARRRKMGTEVSDVG